MYGRILGFQRLERCPKWTPASTICLTRVVDTWATPGKGAPAMSHCGASRRRPTLGQVIRPGLATPGVGPIEPGEPCSLSERTRSVNRQCVAAKLGGVGTCA